MLEMIRARSLTAVGLALLLGCGGVGSRAREPKDEAAKLEEKRSFVQAVACLSPAVEKACDPGLAATFEAPASAPGPDRKKGAIWCEGGRPHTRVMAASGEVTGEFGQVVWEAIWRVLRATDSCASAYGAPISVTRDGQSQTCRDPRFDMHALLDMAAFMAKKGPPARAWRAGKDLCAINPTACIDARTMCPLFLGDPWSGVTAEIPSKPHLDLDAEPYAAAEEAPAAEDSGQRPLQPSQGEVTKVLGALLGEARRCLKAGGEPARVTVVFGSDGTVQRVDVKNAAGAAPGCLERALGKAHVARFSAPTYAIGLTVRSHD